MIEFLNGVYMEFPCLVFPKIFVYCRKKIKDIGGFDAFDGRVPYSDLAEDIAGVGYKTGPATPSQFDGARLSETKGAHKS